MFPMHIGGAPITAGYQGVDLHPPPPTICVCPAPPPLFKRVGVGISYWEPARIAEIVRTPYCSPTLGGVTLGEFAGVSGTNHRKDGLAGDAFYQAHWVQYPVLSWLGMGFQSLCLKGETFDIGYMTELDPLWDDDQLSFLLNPEVALFANPIAQVACAADSAQGARSQKGSERGPL